MIFRRGFMALAATALGAAFVVAGASPAQAHETYLYHENDFAHVGPGHTRIVWCDRESDSNPVRVWYYTNAWHSTTWAGYGACEDRLTDHAVVRYCLEEMNHPALPCRDA